MDLDGARGALRIGALQGATGVAAAELFAAQGAVPGAVALGCLALGFGAAALDRRTREWAVTALAAHVVLGMAGGLYARSAQYDEPVHLVVFLGTARLERAVPVLVALALGTLWELFEFAADASGLVTAQRGLADTMLDLAADAAGGLGAAVLWPRATLRACARSCPGSSTGPPSTRRSRSR
jgi:hypothetical protein